jgi:maltose alpha-D-glucosyltransferase/alpha-amylase
MVTLHNFDDAAQTVRLKLELDGARRLVDLIAEEHSQADERGTHEIVLDGYGYRWYRVGVVDETLTRKAF